MLLNVHIPIHTYYTSVFKKKIHLNSYDGRLSSRLWPRGMFWHPPLGSVAVRTQKNVQIICYKSLQTNIFKVQLNKRPGFSTRILFPPLISRDSLRGLLHLKTNLQLWGNLPFFILFPFQFQKREAKLAMFNSHIALVNSPIDLRLVKPRERKNKKTHFLIHEVRNITGECCINPLVLDCSRCH